MVSPTKTKPDSDALVDGPVTPKQTSSLPTSPSSGPSHSTPTTARKKRRPQSEIDAEKKVKEAKKERDMAYKTSLVAWKEIANFKLPANIPTITKGDAKKQYKLNDRDMGTRIREENFQQWKQHETVFSPQSSRLM
ncbi:hypothetical protein ARMSODRAFT_962809 [Armillaria solidipes]|uniref:Uncharacterized protein n=1 Tax=Armillaria solidipes TaxID=1076256 RepID=A0A2H3B230_9AGAR|nr:hypothetical protein ARMSODRAFT_962809 [Armillaria solidipes]